MMAGRRRVERRYSALETSWSVTATRLAWRPCGESNPGLRVEGPANGPLVLQGQSRARVGAGVAQASNLLGLRPPYQR